MLDRTFASHLRLLKLLLQQRELIFGAQRRRRRRPFARQLVAPGPLYKCMGGIYLFIEGRGRHKKAPPPVCAPDRSATPFVETQGRFIH